MTEDMVVEFLLEPIRSEWFHTHDMNVFVRKSKRNGPTDGILYVNCFDIANITVANRGQGIFTNWLRMLSDVLPAFGVDYMYIESVLNKRLADKLRLWNWQEDEKLGFYYKVEHYGTPRTDNSRIG